MPLHGAAAPAFAQRGNLETDIAILNGRLRWLSGARAGARQCVRWPTPIGVAALLLLAVDVRAHNIADDDMSFPLATAVLPVNPANAAAPPSPEVASAPGEHEPAPQWLSPAPLPAVPSLNEDEFTPPVATASRVLLRRPGRQVTPGPAAVPGGTSIAATTGLVPAGEDILATLNNLQHTVAELIVDTTNARVGPGGDVSFSVAGIEGFHYSARDGQASIGHGDLSLSVVDHTGDRRQPAAATRLAPAIPASHDVSPPLQFIELLREVLAYPLVWVLAFLLLVARIALLIASRRARKQRRRRRSVSRQPERPQKVRKRVRIRIRQRQPVIGVQQPR